MNTHALMHSFISCRSLFLLLSSSNIGYENEQNSHKYHSDSDCLLRMLLQYDVCDRNKVGFNDYYFWPNFTILFRYFSCLVALCLEAFVFFFDGRLLRFDHVKCQNRMPNDSDNNMEKSAAKENKMRCKNFALFSFEQNLSSFSTTL